MLQMSSSRNNTPSTPAAPAAPTAPTAVTVLAALRPLLDVDTLDPDPLTSVLRVVTSLTPGVAGATLCRRRPGRSQLRTAAATDPASESLDSAQLRAAGCGPILNAARAGATISVDDVTTDTRWAALARRLTGRPPVAAMSIPIQDASRQATVLTLYSGAPLGVVEQAQVPLMIGLLEVALVALAQHERVRNLRHATTSNRRIGIAVGVLMAHDHHTADQAFDSLARASQTLNRKVADLAEDVIFTGALPQQPDTTWTLPPPRTATT